EPVSTSRWMAPIETSTLLKSGTRVMSTLGSAADEGVGEGAGLGEGVGLGVCAEAVTARASAAAAIVKSRFMACLLSPEIRPARGVAAVDVLVAVLAGVLGRAIRAELDRRARVDAAVERAGMAGVEVAALAEPRLLRDEQLVVVRAVRVV